MIVTYCDDTAAPERWDAYLRVLQDRRGQSTRHLIYCAAAPPSDVLGRIANAARGQPWTVSLISPSTAVRFAASTFSMIIRGFRFFAPDRLRDALLHLHCDDAEQEQARRALARCRGVELSLPPR